MKQKLKTHLQVLMGAKSHATQAAALCQNHQGHVLLLTSRDTKRWVLPKGWPMRHKTLAEAALQEAWEEAGVIGRVQSEHLDVFTYNKQTRTGFTIPVACFVYHVVVEDMKDEFPEAQQRTRAWFSLQEASKIVNEKSLQHLFEKMSETSK